MKITTFIFDSFTGKEDLDSLEKSIEPISDKIIFVKSFEDVNAYSKGKNWFLLLRKDEFLQNELVDAISFYIKSLQYKCFSLFKVDDIDKFTLCPRLFHPDVKIDKNWMPIGLKKDQITNGLDGWIFGAHE